ncbi:MAG: phosphate signaling complex protein PhoU [Verrucomicrobia bacterium]|nr:phosphate signaling complex protein PhoU [Verrucomicrobiota bacterium]MDA1087692.1 phosphate signaling complex protein PhoU [Verrucomicrobiota bacterium]
MATAAHLEESLQQDIDGIRRKVRRMAKLAERALRDARKALFESDGHMAYAVILQDKQIDELEKEVDRLCLEFLIRQQPAAGHLRFAYAVIKINQELERIGDYAESIARECLVINSLKIDFNYAVLIELSDCAISMLHRSMDAFLSQDEDLALAAIKDNETAKAQRDTLLELLIDLRLEGAIPLEALAPLITVVRRFERVANQATNMCEDTVYMCTGKNMKHMGRESFRVLFVDDSNSSASQMAEAIGNAGRHANFVFSSAGTDPIRLDENTVRFLETRGMDISSNITKSIGHVPNLDHYQVIIALSKGAAAVFPPPPTQTVNIEWKLPSQGDDGDDRLEKIFDYLSEQILHLVGALQGEEAKAKQDKEEDERDS